MPSAVDKLRLLGARFIIIEALDGVATPEPCRKEIERDRDRERDRERQRERQRDREIERKHVRKAFFIYIKIKINITWRS